MSDRERVEAEAWKSARESEPNLEAGEGHVSGFIAGRTLTSKQVEAMERAVDRHNGNLFNPLALVTEAIEAAGLLVEGEDDE